MAITMTEKAVHAVKSMMGRQGAAPASTYLRVDVTGGGCSGFGYGMAFASEKTEDDRLFDCDGVQVICDPKAYLYLQGTQIDFKDGVMGQGFSFHNPNASGSCGCGKSFSV